LFLVETARYVCRLQTEDEDGLPGDDEDDDDDDESPEPEGARGNLPSDSLGIKKYRVFTKITLYPQLAQGWEAMC
jgi:hypothetical protein